jgi:hypothetical protein
MRTPGPIRGCHNVGTFEKQEAFLRAVVEVLTIGGACRVSGTNRSSVFRWMESDPAFRQAVHDAQEQALDVLESALYQRALAKSDTLGMFILNGRRSSIYKYTSRIEHTGAGGGPVQYVIRLQTEAEALPYPQPDGVSEAELLACEDAVDDGLLLLAEGDEEEG